MSTNNHQLTISVERPNANGGKWRAYANDNRSVMEEGETQEEAIGRLMFTLAYIRGDIVSATPPTPTGSRVDLMIPVGGLLG